MARVSVIQVKGKLLRQGAIQGELELLYQVERGSPAAAHLHAGNAAPVGTCMLGANWHLRCRDPQHHRRQADEDYVSTSHDDPNRLNAEVASCGWLKGPSFQPKDETCRAALGGATMASRR